MIGCYEHFLSVYFNACTHFDRSVDTTFKPYDEGGFNRRQDSVARSLFSPYHSPDLTEIPVLMLEFRKSSIHLGMCNTVGFFFSDLVFRAFVSVPEYLFLNPLYTGVSVCVYSNSRNDISRVAQRYGIVAAHTRRRASVLVVFVVFCVQMYSFDGLIRRTTPPMFSDTAITDRHSDTTGCGYPGLFDRKIVRTCAPGGSRTSTSCM